MTTVTHSRMKGLSKMTTDTHVECPSLLANMNVTQPPYRPQLGTFFSCQLETQLFPPARHRQTETDRKDRDGSALDPPAPRSRTGLVR
jgi:hypothetical protein